MCICESHSVVGKIQDLHAFFSIILLINFILFGLNLTLKGFSSCSVFYDSFKAKECYIATVISHSKNLWK